MIPIGRAPRMGWVIATVVLAVGGMRAAAQDAPRKPLYDRLGGVYSIATVVDDFIERVLVDATLNANPFIEAARHRVPKAGLKFQVTALVCQATGGPHAYTGRDMKSSHAHLNITEKEWQALGADFKASLDHFKVPEAEQKELFAIVESTKKDIVVEHPELAGRPAPAPEKPEAIPDALKGTLYGRLGGVYPIATVVDDFIGRLLANDTLNANAKIREARDRVPKAGLKFQVTALVCQSTGGPQKYAGRAMKDAHAHLDITEKEWAAMAADFKKSLDHFQVPEKEQAELFSIVGTTKADIVKPAGGGQGAAPGGAPGGVDPAQTSDDEDYGYAKADPIKVGWGDELGGPKAERMYLERLRDASGKPLAYDREGSVGGGPDGHILDWYILTASDGRRIDLYLDMYHPDCDPRKAKAPKGLYVTP